VRKSSTEAQVLSYQSYGNPFQVLKLTQEKVKEPASNEVQIQLLASPVHSYDLGKIFGVLGKSENDKLPAVAGTESVGVVVKVGSGVSSLKLNDRVISVPASFGSWRTQAVVKESNLIKINSSLQPEQAALLGVSGATAVRLLEDFGTLKSGDVIIQNGANGAVGQTVVQLAAKRGIKTISVIPDSPNHADVVEKLKSYGAYLVVNESYLKTAAFRKLISDLPQPSLAFDYSGGRSALEMARVLKESGTLVSYGGSGRSPLQFPSSLFLYKDLRVRGFSLKRWYNSHSAQEQAQVIKTLEQELLGDRLKVWVERHKFAQYAEALKRAADLTLDRKVVLVTE